MPIQAAWKDEARNVGNFSGEAEFPVIHGPPMKSSFVYSAVL